MVFESEEAVGDAEYEGEDEEAVFYACAAGECDREMNTHTKTDHRDNNSNSRKSNPPTNAIPPLRSQDNDR